MKLMISSFLPHIFFLFHCFVVVVPASALPAMSENQSNAGTAPAVPAVLVFGDSIVDTGNNNGLNTIAKCNFPPYGINFPGHRPTGRFCNGRVPSDFIASLLGVKEYLPPYLGKGLGPADLLTGVVFASGGAGLDPLTSKLASAISLQGQLELFREYKQKVRAIAGGEMAERIFSGSLYVLCLGSDDVANTYFPTPFRKEYDPPSYANLLVRSAVSFVKELIQEGGRRIGVVGIPPIGCVPSQRTVAGGAERACAAGQNELARLYNEGLAAEIQQLNANYSGMILVYVDIYYTLLDMMQNPHNYGKPYN
ncbi:GDSL esterase/lipase EXL3 [Apostasia shenzhenica]|uniref:GDSL esterase/lipase EXL3 n=1 Tax=Apostasia shenzhenica TaxID=1088818 RepID=A0A2I0AKM7_9ASPA|nr:GDSL esterase/lipase EXL3 [Apostasia shenzhenica]